MEGKLKVNISGLSINLGNLYDSYCADPAALSDLMDEYVASTVDLLARGPDAPPRRELIMPMVASRSKLDARREEHPNTDHLIVFEELNDELVVFYVEDRGISTSGFTEAALQNAGLSRGELRSLALENLRKTVADLEIEEGAEPTEIFGGTFTTSLILLDDFWSPWEAKVDGELVVSIPQRYFVFFTGSNDKVRLQRLREIAHEEQADRYNITETLYVRRDGRFIRFDG